MNSILESLYLDRENTLNSIEELNVKLKYINALIAIHEKTSLPQPHTVVQSIQTNLLTKEELSTFPYSSTLTYKQKITFALKELGKATANQITDFLHKYEPKSTREEIHKMVTHYCWVMTKQDKIPSLKAENIDSKTKNYSLI